MLTVCLVYFETKTGSQQSCIHCCSPAFQSSTLQLYVGCEANEEYSVVMVTLSPIVVSLQKKFTGCHLSESSANMPGDDVWYHVFCVESCLFLPALSFLFSIYFTSFCNFHCIFQFVSFYLHYITLGFFSVYSVLP